MLPLLRQSNVVAVAYSMTDRSSFEDAKSQWIPAAQGIDCPIVLVATKSDDLPNRVVSSAEGRMLALEYNFSYIEASSKEQRTVERLFIHLASMCTTPAVLDDMDRPPKSGIIDYLLNFFKRS
jgi:GTPase SAR1 family protein